MQEALIGQRFTVAGRLGDGRRERVGGHGTGGCILRGIGGARLAPKPCAGSSTRGKCCTTRWNRKRW